MARVPNLTGELKMEPNFLVFELCDNDFSGLILSAVEYAVSRDFLESAGMDAQWWKAFVVAFVKAELVRLHLPDTSTSNYCYLTLSLRVSAARQDPSKTADHGGGSVVLCLHSKHAWTF